MAYSFGTPKYQLPFMGDGDTMSSTQERIAHTIIENQLRGGIFGAGGTRVLDDGTYSAQTLTDGTTVVTLSGSPALRGFANEGFVEVYGFIRWENLQPSTVYYLYVLASNDTYLDPADVEPVSSVIQRTSPEYLLLAHVDTTGASPGSPPTVDSSPTGKAIAFNLFELLNNNIDPFGTAMTQSILTILQQLTVRLGQDRTALFQQLNQDATLPVISIENESDKPELFSANELRFGDIRIPAGFALSDEANDAYLGTAISIIGALNEVFRSLVAHISDNTDPHGETLTQTRLILRDYLQLPQLILDPTGISPSPGGSPGGLCGIRSLGELVFCDERGSISLTQDGDGDYQGDAISIVGALNELLNLISGLTSFVNQFLGENQPAHSPLTFEISPDDIGYNLHFMITVSDHDDFESVVLVKESKASATGWYYEYQEPEGSLIFQVREPNQPPGEVTLPSVPHLPEWKLLPSSGLPGSLQVHPDGRPVRVQYRWADLDTIYSRRHYRIVVQQFNLEYGEAELASMVFG